MMIVGLSVGFQLIFSRNMIRILLIRHNGFAIIFPDSKGIMELFRRKALINITRYKRDVEPILKKQYNRKGEN